MTQGATSGHQVDLEHIHPASSDEWRQWLQAHHATSLGVWVVQWRTVTGKRRVPYESLVEEALCFGWIDSRTNQLDDERSMIMMTPRRPASGWAPSNKQRVERLIATGRMTDAGLRSVEAAKANGAWTILDDVEAMVVPADLLSALAKNRRAQRYFEAFPPSAKKSILYWIKSAKRSETRHRRITESVRLAADNRRAPPPPGS